MTPAAAVIINAAERVRRAEDQVTASAKHLRSIVERLERALEGGSSLNSLGELQGNGPDAAIVALEAAAEAFKLAWNYLEPLSHAWTQDERDWIDHEVGRSPRLQTIVRHLAEGSQW